MPLLLAGYSPERVLRSTSSPAAADEAPEDPHRPHVGRTSKEPLAVKVDPPKAPVVDNRRIAVSKFPLGNLVVVERASKDIAPLARLELEPDFGLNRNDRDFHIPTMREMPSSDSVTTEPKKKSRPRSKKPKKRRIDMPDSCWIRECKGHARFGSRNGTAAGFCGQHWRAIPRLLRIELLLGRIRRQRFEYFLLQAFAALGCDSSGNLKPTEHSEGRS